MWHQFSESFKRIQLYVLGLVLNCSKECLRIMLSCYQIRWFLIQLKILSHHFELCMNVVCKVINKFKLKNMKFSKTYNTKKKKKKYLKNYKNGNKKNVNKRHILKKAYRYQISVFIGSYHTHNETWCNLHDFHVRKLAFYRRAHVLFMLFVFVCV